MGGRGVDQVATGPEDEGGEAWLFRGAGAYACYGGTSRGRATTVATRRE